MNTSLKNDFLSKFPLGYAYFKVVGGDTTPLYDYIIVDVNRAFESIIQLKKDDIIGRPISAIVPSLYQSVFESGGEIQTKQVNQDKSLISEHLFNFQNRIFKVFIYSPSIGYYAALFTDITQEKELSNELETFFSLNLDLLCITDMSGKFIKVNKEWQNVLGYSIDEIINASALSFIHPDDIEKTKQVFKDLSKQKKVVGFVNRYRTKDSSYRYIEWRNHTKDGLVYAAARDITSKVVKENLLKLRLELNAFAQNHTLEELVQKSIDSISDLLESRIGYFLRIDPVQKSISMLEWSTKTWDLIYAFAAKDINLSIDELVSWIDYKDVKEPVFNNSFRLFDDAENPYEGDHEIRRQLLVPVMRQGSVMALLGIGGKPSDYNYDDAQMASFVADVTWEIIERKAKEVEIQKLSQAMQQSPASVIITNTNGIIEYVNPKFTKVTGYSFDEVIGKNPRILKSGITTDDEYKSLWETIRDGKEWKGEFHNVKKSGEVFWEQATISPVKNDFGTVTHYIAVKEDITERKMAEKALVRSEAKLKELNTTKDKFFSIIGHDIKSVFNSLLLATDLLKQHIEMQNFEEIALLSDMLKEAAQNGYALLDNLLSWSRMQTGRVKYNPVSINLFDTFRVVLSLYKPSLEEKNISVDVDIDKSAEIVADRFMLETVLRNLISNAIKFSKSGDTIQLIAKHIDGSIKISVIDQGVGIDENDIPKLFRIETSYSTPGTNNETGTGLGLILCKEFVRKHNGKIWVESKLGVGTSIHFTIPNA